jgi:glycosyltransferase involved in cell wall biosynthesis
LARLAPTWVAVARELAEEGRRYLGIEDIQVIPNGVDTARYKPADRTRRVELRKKLGWPEKALVFLYVGRLSSEKRLPLFTELWAEACRGVARPCFWALAGDGPEAGAIDLAARYARCAERVKRHASFDSIEEAYAAADVFVLPSVSEGLSNALLEAMASGLTVLASRVGGTPEAVEDGVSGLLFSAADDAELKAKLARLLQEPDLAPMGAAARETALERFSLEAIAKRYEALYRAG